MDEGRSPASREHLQADIVTRDAHDGEEFVMTAGGQMFSGKGAREEAAKALARAVFLRRDDGELVRPIGFDFAFATACVGK